MAVAWYVRDNSTMAASPAALALVGHVPGSVGWSAMTGWAASTSTAPGTLRRQSAGTSAFTASQSGTTLTVTLATGTIYLGQSFIPSAGSTVQTITALGTGTGGAGTYTTSGSFSVASTTWVGSFTATNERAFVAVQSATQNTGATEPAWVLTKGAKTTDGSVTWMECTGQAAVNGDLTNTQNWAAVKNTALALGRIITDNAGTHIFIVTTAGTTGNGSEPSWTTSATGNTTADNTVTWTYIGTSFSSWAAPSAYAWCVLASTYSAAGDSFYLGDDHSEQATQAGGFGILAFPGTATSPNFMYSIDHTLSLPVGSSGPKAGAIIQVLNQALFVNGQSSGGNHAYIFGVTFIASNAANAGNLAVGDPTTGDAWTRLDSCVLKLGGSSSGNILNLSGSANNSLVELINTPCQFTNAGQQIKLINPGKVIWRNTPSAIGGTTPTTLFYGGASINNGTLICEGVDLSAISGTLVPAGSGNQSYPFYYFIDCKLNSGVTIAATPTYKGGPFVEAVRCGSSSSTYIQRRYSYQGTLQEEATIIRTGGASDGTTGVSWNLTTTANAKWVLPFESFPISVWNTTTGANRTVTLHGVWSSASLPNNDDLWLEIAYLGDSGSPRASFANSTKANNLASGAALTADSTSAWDSQITARANTTAYILGNVRKVASNPGRVFFCTTAGTSAGSEPGGYASAVDGDSVTDGGAVFRAGYRFSLAVTLSTPQPQLAGDVRAYVKAAKASATFYVDPLPVLS